MFEEIPLEYALIPKENFVYKQGETYYVINRKKFKETSKRFFSCDNNQKYIGPGHVDSFEAYENNRAYVKLWPNLSVVQEPDWWHDAIPDGKVFRLEEYITFPALVSKDVMDGGTMVSADHCNHTSPVKTYFLVPEESKVVRVSKKNVTIKGQLSSHNAGAAIFIRTSSEATGLEGIYTGEMLDNKPHGKGQFSDDNETYYDGEFKNGTMHGYGVLKYDPSLEFIFEYDSATYEGGFHDGKKHGDSIFLMGDKTFKGPYKNGFRHGTFHITHADGRTEEVEYEKGKDPRTLRMEQRAEEEGEESDEEGEESDEEGEESDEEGEESDDLNARDRAQPWFRLGLDSVLG